MDNTRPAARSWTVACGHDPTPRALGRMDRRYRWTSPVDKIWRTTRWFPSGWRSCSDTWPTTWKPTRAGWAAQRPRPASNTTRCAGWPPATARSARRRAAPRRRCGLRAICPPRPTTSRASTAAPSRRGCAARSSSSAVLRRCCSSTPKPPSASCAPSRPTIAGDGRGIHSSDPRLAGLARAWIRFANTTGLQKLWGPTDGCIGLTNEDVDVLYALVTASTWLATEGRSHPLHEPRGASRAHGLGARGPRPPRARNCWGVRRERLPGECDARRASRSSPRLTVGAAVML
ncbi:hypothetical protein [Sorangium sp. So ce693]|uniref:hypothetical protein n=1 Tax=Sorangium sp. So ce693 TaxID=3133318 RepID=UPI003F644AF8